MKLGFDVTPLCVPQSGVGTYTLNLVEQLHRLRDDTVVPLAHRPVMVTRNGMPPAVLPSMQTNKTVWMQMLLPFQLKSLGVHLAHFTNSVAPLVSPCPTIVTLHDMTLWLYPQHHYRRRLLAMRPFIPLVVQRSAAIVTVSESAKADIVRLLKVPIHKVHVVYEAADPAFRPMPPETATRLLARHRLPEQYILYVGTLEPRKNLERLVEAFAALVADGHPHHLILAGQRGWKEAPLFATIERLGVQDRVQVLTHLPIEELVALYNRAELLAFPSLYEGFGLPVIEAMACGTAVLTSRRGSLAEIAGEAAHFVEPREVSSIHEGLQCLLTDHDYRRHLQSTGRIRAATFAWEKTAVETGHLYEQVTLGVHSANAANAAHLRG
jgi:glycosyltransferase involved in cell wall biosynthesis